MSLKAGLLTLNKRYAVRSVQLAKLDSAEKYKPFQLGPDRTVLRLKDSEGGRLDLWLDDYKATERQTIVTALSPYIFITRVDKNFTKLI